MGLYKYRPEPSGSMGALWALSTVRNAAIIEFGAMGHMVDARIALEKAGVAQPAGLFSTHIDDIDITLGGVDRIKASIDHILTDQTIKAVFLLPSATPEIIGTDFGALVAEIQPLYTQAQIIDLNFSSLTSSSNSGVQESLLRLASRFARSTGSTNTFNIIGSCADFMRFHADAEEIIRMMKGAFDMSPCCVLTSDTSIEEINMMGNARLNLVLRKEGLPAAEYLQEKFGTQFIEGRPYGMAGTLRWLESVGELVGRAPDKAFLAREYKEVDYSFDMFEKLYRRTKFYGRTALRLSASSHSDVVKGLSSFADELGFDKGHFWCNNSEGATKEIPWLSESEWEALLPDMEDDVLMSDGDVLAVSGRTQDLLLAHPHRRWSICVYNAPFMGFRGAINLISMWVYEIQKRSEASYI